MSLNRRQFTLLGLSAVAATALSATPSLAGSRKGKFTGRSNHVTNGTVTVKTKGGKQVIVLGDDFFFDGAPDPKLAFGNNGRHDKSTYVHRKLPKKQWRGASEHVVPAGIDVSKYSEVYVWCERFNVPLGVATIE